MLLLVMMLTTACSSKSPIYVQQPFLGFNTYPLPNDVKLEVERNCVATYMLNDYKTKVDVGNCVRESQVKELIIKTRILESIVNNYELDIKAYNRLHK